MGTFSISGKIGKRRTQTDRTFQIGGKRIGSRKTPPGGGRTMHFRGRRRARRTRA